MTVNELAATLQALITAGKGEAPVWVRRHDGPTCDDEPADITCGLPYIDRDTPERVLID